MNRYIGLLAAGLVMIVAACGDDDNGTTTATDDTIDTTDTSSAATGVTTGGSPSGSGSAAPEGCPPPEGTDQPVQEFDDAPPMCIDVDASYQAIVTTNLGEFTIDLDPQAAPETTNNFVFLARNRYFDNTVCHRIIPGFVVQCGDPTASGTGGPGYSFADELPEAGEYQIGSIAMANSGPDTNGSQFFIITGDDGAALPPLYSLFGQVDTGFDETVVEMEAAGSIQGLPTSEVRIETIEIVES